ncbi:MAG: hypothetical protein ACRDZ3_23485 [Acidimicrobiia bacterium]
MEDPNVYREVITGLRTQIQRLHPGSGGDLVEGARLAHRPDVWGGPFAARWTADLDGRMNHLVNQIIDADLMGLLKRLEAELAGLEEATRAPSVPMPSPPPPGSAKPTL